MPAVANRVPGVRVPLGRGRRICLEILGPPALGALPFMLLAMAGTAMKATVQLDWTQMVQDAAISSLIVLGYAYLVMGLPSLVYAAVMELCYARGLDPRSSRTLVISGLLGMLAGVGGAVAPGGGIAMWGVAVWAVLGLGVGLAIAGLVGHWS